MCRRPTDRCGAAGGQGPQREGAQFPAQHAPDRHPGNGGRTPGRNAPRCVQGRVPVGSGSTTQGSGVQPRHGLPCHPSGADPEAARRAIRQRQRQAEAERRAGKGAADGAAPPQPQETPDPAEVQSSPRVDAPPPHDAAQPSSVATRDPAVSPRREALAESATARLAKLARGAPLQSLEVGRKGNVRLGLKQRKPCSLPGIARGSSCRLAHSPAFPALVWCRKRLRLDGRPCARFRSSPWRAGQLRCCMHFGLPCTATFSVASLLLGSPQDGVPSLPLGSVISRPN